MKTKLLNVLGVGLLAAAFAPLRAQYAYFDTTTWVGASPADGSWWAGADVTLKNDWYGDWSMADMKLQSLVYENGSLVKQFSNEGGPPDVSYEWNSPNQVQLNATYQVDTLFSWQNPPDAMTGDPGPSGGNHLIASIRTPPPPSLGLLSIDATNPHSVQFTYTASPEIYSSTLAAGTQNGFSIEATQPRFALDQSLFETLHDSVATTPIEFYANLAGYEFGPVSCYVNVDNHAVTDYSTWTFQEGGEAPGLVLLKVVHTGSENINAYSYCMSAPGLVNKVNSAHGNIDTSQNACSLLPPEPECDIALMNEVNRYLGFQDVLTLDPYDGGGTPGTSTPDTLKSMSMVYPDLFLPSQTPMAVCNTLLMIQTLGGQVPMTMGCINNLLLP